jgi:hypothetical protein
MLSARAEIHRVDAKPSLPFEISRREPETPSPLGAGGNIDMKLIARDVI